MTTSPVSLQEQDAIGVLRIHNPPVNALSPAVVQGLIEGLDAFERSRNLRALVVHCEGAGPSSPAATLRPSTIPRSVRRF